MLKHRIRNKRLAEQQEFGENALAVIVKEELARFTEGEIAGAVRFGLKAVFKTYGVIDRLKT